MPSISGTWIGTIQGTNQGAIVTTLQVNGSLVFGTAHINDAVLGPSAYAARGQEINPGHFRLALFPAAAAATSGIHGAVTAFLNVAPNDTLEGSWRSTIGTSGTLLASKVPTAPLAAPPATPPTPAKVPPRYKVFISYSHKDTEFREEVNTHLRPLVREGVVDVWDDTLIQAGDEWREEIKNAIAAARVAILIVTPHFMASDFIAKDELPPLLKAAQEDGATILALHARPVLLDTTPIVKYQAINDPARTLVDLTNIGERDRVLVALAKRVQALMK